MQYEQLGDQYVLRLDEGEEAVSTIGRFLTQRNILGGRFLAWGAFSWLKLQHRRPHGGRYQPRFVVLERQVEVAGLLGNIGVLADEPVIYACLTVSDEEFRSYSGCLVEGIVRPMLEVFVSPLPRAVHRFWNAGLNLAVLDPEEAPEEAERLAAWP